MKPIGGTRQAKVTKAFRNPETIPPVAIVEKVRDTPTIKKSRKRTRVRRTRTI